MRHFGNRLHVAANHVVRTAGRRTDKSRNGENPSCRLGTGLRNLRQEGRRKTRIRRIKRRIQEEGG